MSTFTFGTAFTGIGAFDLALERIGGQCLWQIEIDPHAQHVLRRHFPTAAIYPDIRHALTYRLSIPTVFAFGSPCQDVSVAGERAGLAGSESGLFYDAHELHRSLGSRYVIFENVPGLLSSHGGEDFAVVIGAFTGVLPEIPRDGWGNAGFARGADGRHSVAWRVLDAKHFGVPQRRRRVFLVASLGDASCVEILFESESVSWDHRPSEEAPSDLAGTLGSCTAGGGHRTTDLDGSGAFIPIETGTLLSSKGGPTDKHACADQLIPMRMLSMGTCVQDEQASFQKHRDHKSPTDLVLIGSGNPELVGTLCAKGKAAGSATQRDAENGNLVLAFDPPQVTSGQNRSNPQLGGPCHTLPAHGHPATIAFQTAHQQQRGTNVSIGCAHTLSAAPTSEQVVTVPIGFNNSQDPVSMPDQSPTIGTNSGGELGVATCTAGGWQVRRLTPTEHERLQGFPDGWTQWGLDERGKRTDLKDGPRYRLTGNSIAVVCLDWICRRLQPFLTRG